jgi:hypothetical protein
MYSIKGANIGKHPGGYMEKSEKEALRNEALNRSNDYWADRAKEWEEDAPSGSVVCAMKKILWGEYQSKDLDTDGTRRVRNYTTIIEAFREIVERVMELSAEEYDAIYSSVLNDKACISHAIRKIVSGAPSSIQIECMFDSKKILLRSVWPEYYAAHYSRPTIWEIFNAQGSLKSGLIRAGKPKYFKEENTGAEQKKDGTFSTAKKERKHTVNHGAEVDRIVYHAMKAVFSKLNITTEELFASLAEPKKSGWGSYGFVQVIEARE